MTKQNGKSRVEGIRFKTSSNANDFIVIFNALIADFFQSRLWRETTHRIQESARNTKFKGYGLSRDIFIMPFEKDTHMHIFFLSASKQSEFFILQLQGSGAF